ncbi:MAG: UDP-N-acetylmuramoyl-L-alanyl-D-glutamate--2,6-diaminopimelate ligase [Cytophagales bacterium]|nr:UDP-N-acetylmuramoyl-L-alanyl-D-glutamate--2,6-diaminopimelate ligase [Cytophagales bacterium]
MKILKDLLKAFPKDLLIEFTSLTAKTLDIEVKGLQLDSREVKEGELFTAIRGEQVDGHKYIEKTYSKKPSVIVCEEFPKNLQEEVVYLLVQSSHEALAYLSSAFYDYPSQQLKLVGVTGTNGKTTTATLLYHLFEELGHNVGLLSTVENKIMGEVIPSTHTTPNPIALNALLARMVQKGCTHCFMEVSSHAIVQHRITGLDFDGAIFSNITHDHLDYHKTFDAYIKAKKMFFDNLTASAFALVNIDDNKGRIMVQNTDAKIQTYALKNPADFKVKVIDDTLQGLHLEVQGLEVWCKLIGDFNAYNLISVFATAILLEEEEEQVLTVLSTLPAVRGRFEQVVGQKVTGIVDYAHTPDALSNVLETIDELRSGNEQVITVVGCGGDRDAMKRPKMAKIACEGSNHVILTTDNPRFENPVAILEDMKTGVSPVYTRRTEVIQDREEAIRKACEIAQAGDVILVAGKGHETYQDIKGVKHHFDDKEILIKTFEKLSL